MSRISGSGILLALLVSTMLPGLDGLFLSQVVMGIYQVAYLLSLQKTVGNIKENRDQLVVMLSLAGAMGDMLRAADQWFRLGTFRLSIRI